MKNPGVILFYRTDVNQYSVAADRKKGGCAVGMYLNPGNSGFTRIRNDIYVDKSGLGLYDRDPPDKKRWFAVGNFRF